MFFVAERNKTKQKKSDRKCRLFQQLRSNSLSRSIVKDVGHFEPFHGFCKGYDTGHKRFLKVLLYQKFGLFFFKSPAG